MIFPCFSRNAIYRNKTHCRKPYNKLHLLWASNEIGRNQGKNDQKAVSQQLKKLYKGCRYDTHGKGCHYETRWKVLVCACLYIKCFRHLKARGQALHGLHLFPVRYWMVCRLSSSHQSFRIHLGSHCVDGHGDLVVLKVVSIGEIFALSITEPPKTENSPQIGRRSPHDSAINTESTALRGWPDVSKAKRGVALGVGIEMMVNSGHQRSAPKSNNCQCWFFRSIPWMFADPSPNRSFHHQNKRNQQRLFFVSQICSHQIYL